MYNRGNIPLFKKIIFVLILGIAVGVFVGALGTHAEVEVCSDGSTECNLGSPLKGGTTTISELACLIIQFFTIKLMPPAIIFMVLWASFLFLTAAGQPGKVIAARTTLLWAMVGATILLMAIPLISFVVETLGGKIPPQCGSTVAGAASLSVVYTLINWFSWGLAILSVGVGLYAGFLYMTSRGEPQKVTTAGRVIFYAVVGVLVAIIAFSIEAIINNFITIP